MRFLAISGSARLASTNTAMLRAFRSAASAEHAVVIYDRIGELPVFSPDLEQPQPPQAVLAFAQAIAAADGLIVASPEYVRAIPGGLKNAIDWLVSRDELVGKPIALVHASHRGDDMLQQLRIVLATVSDRFNADLFLRFELAKLSPHEIGERLGGAGPRAEMREFLDEFSDYCASL
jgi:chromate reductase, NAD(P)H dehydrogenase (quinone)